MAALALAPAGFVLLVAFVLPVAWTLLLSVTPTRILPRYEFVGLANYGALLDDDRAVGAFRNLLSFFVLMVPTTVLLGLLLAIGVGGARRPVRAALRFVYVLPLSLSWLVTGLLWGWILNPSIGLERTLREAGWVDVRFAPLAEGGTALLAVAGAAAWHAAGLVMLIFLAAFGRVDPAIWGAMRADGIPAHRAYLHVILPMLRGPIVTATILVSFIAARTFDLVVAMTGGGPGFATDLPTHFVFDHLFPRGRGGVAAACAVVLVLTVTLATVPWLLAMRRRHGE